MGFSIILQPDIVSALPFTRLKKNPKMLSLINNSLGEIVLFFLTPRTQESQAIMLLRITQSLGSLLISSHKSAFTKHGAFAACTADYQ